MARKRVARWLMKYAPRQEVLARNRLLRPISGYIGDPNVWHFNRHSIARGVALGLFLGFVIPIGFQVFIAAFVAVSARANIAVAALFTTVSNPVTVVPIYIAALKTGDWMLGRETSVLAPDANILMIAQGASVPVILGTICFGAISGAVGFLTIHFLWRYWVSRRWMARLARRARRA
ncbi:DUF2062 domain-containing protein [Pacificimonas sp. WHA3]|uniref:DUF2062 domain-containing protein n=1 Tax=Pacificimonas pallii TaxID=2827236 RepID=A0ABS6SGL3_9SPHN|nr:DUF2062 domain-containing protein [Pacificimonas pallii]MBV7257026.1 DUF2062 domain-containing protein [Pacificimonas pallii]